MHLLATLIDASAPDIFGGAGWAGAGILGLVLGWLLLKHLPSKDQQLKEFIDAKDKALLALSQACDTERRAAREDFRASLEQISSHHESQMNALVEALHREIDALAQTIRTLAAAIEERGT